jgi:hypothetical protein
VKHLAIPALACLPLLCIGLAPSRAQDPITGIRPARGLAPVGLVYTGHSTDGNLQAALDDALAKAQQGVADQSVISDATFAWDLTAIHGVRGGFMGLQDIWVEVTLR